MRKDDVRELMRDIDQRRRDRRDKVARWTGVVAGVGVVFAAWLVPGYWSLRKAFCPVPFFADQWTLMAVIGFGIMLVVQRTGPRPRFPYLEA
jgi:hypothetical protein